MPCTTALRRMLDGMERVSPLILTTKTGQSFKKRYFARLWDEAMTKAGLQSVTLPGSDQPVELHFHDLRGTTVTLLSEAGCTPQQIATITGHSLKTVHRILERYLARTQRACRTGNLQFRELPANKVCKPTANRHCPASATKGKTHADNRLTGAPEEIRTPDPQIRSFIPRPFSNPLSGHGFAPDRARNLGNIGTSH